MCSYFKAIYKWFKQIRYFLTHRIHVKVLMGQGNCFFPVNKEEEEEDKNKQEEDKIKTTMQY